MNESYEFAYYEKSECELRTIYLHVSDAEARIMARNEESNVSKLRAIYLHMSYK